MSSRRVVALALFAVCLSACGSSTSATGTTTTTAAAKGDFTYAATPSVSAKMICRAETIKDIETVLGVSTTSRPVGTWANHTYTCPYRYVDGTMTLSVTELPTLAATYAHVASLRTTLGYSGSLTAVGQQGFTTSDGSAVTRKDNKVLLVDVSALPAQFGNPATSRSEVAITVTDIILECWRGD